MYRKTFGLMKYVLLFAFIFSFASFAEEGPGINLNSGTKDTDTITVMEEKQGSIQAADPGLIAQTEPKDNISNIISKTQTAGSANQIILLVDHELSLWNRNEDGHWQLAMEAYAGYGRNGLRLAEERHEGDGTTPIGSFPILFAFGHGENPGTEMAWRQTSPNSYWSDEAATYNTWVESPAPMSGEHLRDYTVCYKYAMAIGFNINPVVFGRGSAIFLHIKNPATWSSSGCVSLEEENMLRLLTLCHDGTYMIIVPDIESIGKY